MNKDTYQKQLHKENVTRLREILETMPPYCKEYFRSKETTTTPKTRIGYAIDIRTFFRFLHVRNPLLKDVDITRITLQDLESLDPMDIEEYFEYLKYYTYDGQEYTNDVRGIKRKFAALRSFYAYFQKHRRITNNPTLIVDMPKLRKNEIVRLDSDEVGELLELVENGPDAPEGSRKRRFFEQCKYRNIALFTLLLGTGIRVSECVGLNIQDLDFKNNRMRIVRKGDKEDFVYFGEEVAQALTDYLEISRQSITAVPGHEDALFLSIQRKRMGVQAIENLVKEYAGQITTFKHITPHKLRSTYGTTLYRETGDIYLVAEVLGHNDVNTTRKHYAALDEDRKRMAAKAVKLR